MPILIDNPTLSDIQRYVIELEKERGFSDQDIFKKCLLLGEEVGELFKSVRHHTKMSVDTHSKTSPVEDELADLVIMICSVANRLNVNLEEAFRNKEEINKKRQWTKEY